MYVCIWKNTKIESQIHVLVQLVHIVEYDMCCFPVRKKDKNVRKNGSWGFDNINFSFSQICQ